MTTERFTLAYADYDWWAICDKENPTEQGISGEDVVELLNELHEENKQLKERIKELQKESYGNLDGLNYYQEQNASLSERISDLECENEQLKSEIIGLKELLKSYRKTIKHDAELLADATKNGYLPPLEDWVELE